MNFYGSSEEHDPVTWVRGHAIYAAHLVVIVFVASMLVGAVLVGTNLSAPLNWLIFDSSAVLRGEVWRVFTYGLVNPPSTATILWFAIDMLMIVWFGRELEKVLGRRMFLLLFAGVYLISPVILTALGRWLPESLAGETGAFAIFIAFATLYPNVPVFFTLLSKWIALVLVGIYTVASLAEHNWKMLITLWATSGFAFLFVRVQQGVITLPRFRFPRRKPKLRVIPGAAAAKVVVPARRQATSTATAEVDALLDKIAQSGFASLTAKERAKLEAARQELKKRSGA
jgi:hypothetical protein